MKTLQIGLDWFPERAGGLQRYFYDLVRSAPTQHIDVKGIVAGSSRVALDSSGTVEAFGKMTDPLLSRLIGARRVIRRTIKNWDPDVVVSHFSLYTVPALNIIDKPIVVHFHGPWASEGEVERNSNLRQGAKIWLEQAVYRRAARCIVLSNAFGTILHERYRIPWDRIRIIPGGIDLSRFTVGFSRANARERLGWPADRPIILSVRRLVRRMGLESLIESMTEVVQRHPDALLLIGGRGPIESELAAEIVRLGLERNVRLVGFISDDDLPLAYRAADFSVVPSTALEGFGLIAAESLAVGTPVLVTPVGGLPEVVRELSGSLVFHSTMAPDLAKRIGDVLSGSVRLPDEAACREYAQARFGWNTIIEKVKRVYKEAI